MWHNLVEFGTQNSISAELEGRLNRSLTSISVMPLHDEIKADLDSAIAILAADQEFVVTNRIVRCEINIRYSHGDEIRGQFQFKADAIDFLRKLK